MRPISQSRLAVVALLSGALSLVWAVGVHLHLCFDGLEAPVVLHHSVDLGNHLDQHDPEEQHYDSDLGFDARLRPTPKNRVDAPAILVEIAHGVAGWRCTPSLCGVDAPASLPAAPRFLQPPLRGPPA